MDKAAPHIPVLLLCQIESCIHHCIAHKCACRVGHADRDSLLLDLLCDPLYRKGGKIGILSVPPHRSVKWLLSVIVRNPGLLQIDTYALYAYLSFSSG